MIVVGGTYTETCNTPRKRSVGGSGLRAAAIIAAAGDPTTLITAVADSEREIADMTARPLGLDVAWRRRTEPVGFMYQTPLGAPTINGRKARIVEPLEAEGENALVFGLIETAELSVRSEKLVFDPQQPRDLESLDLHRFDFQRLVVVANQREVRSLGQNADERQAAAALLEEHHAEAVIIKRGPRGATIVEPSGVTEIGPYPTGSVYPVGSGDAFAAGFARAWGAGGTTVVEAAHIGAQTAAVWADTGSFSAPGAVLTGERTLDHLEPKVASVYLAGPFFSLGERWLIDVVRDALDEPHFSPLHDVGVGGIEVAAADIAGLNACQSVLALLDGGDPGTLYEAGYANARDIPVIGYAERPDNEAWKMLVGTGNEIHSDLSTAVYRSVWAAMGLALHE